MIGRSEVIEQERAAEDARLQVLVNALQQQRALHQQMGDLAKARVAQDQIAAAEAARIANNAIAGAKQTSSDAMLERELEANQNRFNAQITQTIRNVELENMTEMDLIRFHLSEKMSALDTARANDLISAEFYAQQRYLLEVRAQAGLGDASAQGILARRQFEQLNAQQQLQFAFGQMAQMTAGVATHSRAMFNINKVAALSEMAVSLPKGVEKTWDSYPYPWNIPMAALHLVAGLARIAQVRSASFGGATSAPSIGGGTAIPVTPALSGPLGLTPLSQSTSNSSQTVIHVNVYGTVVGSGGMQELTEEYIVPALKDLIDNKDAVIIGANSRQAANLVS
jgi:hypothetical protein